jgi:hypothetical protein
VLEIDEGVIKLSNDPSEKRVKGFDVYDLIGLGIGLPPNRRPTDIVMTVAMHTITSPEESAILLLREIKESVTM